jgi:hypothetical protein
LEFAEELKDMTCKKMMQMIAKCWRTYKSHLVSNYVSKVLNAMVKFKYIAPKDWEDFVTVKVGRTYKERKYGIQEALREEQA